MNECQSEPSAGAEFSGMRGVQEIGEEEASELEEERYEDVQAEDQERPRGEVVDDEVIAIQASRGVNCGFPVGWDGICLCF